MLALLLFKGPSGLHPHSPALVLVPGCVVQRVWSLEFRAEALVPDPGAGTRAFHTGDVAVAIKSAYYEYCKEHRFKFYVRPRPWTDPKGLPPPTPVPLHFPKPQALNRTPYALRPTPYTAGRGFQAQHLRGAQPQH